MSASSSFVNKDSFIKDAQHRFVAQPDAVRILLSAMERAVSQGADGYQIAINYVQAVHEFHATNCAAPISNFTLDMLKDRLQMGELTDLSSSLPTNKL